MGTHRSCARGTGSARRGAAWCSRPSQFVSDAPRPNPRGPGRGVIENNVSNAQYYGARLTFRMDAHTDARTRSVVEYSTPDRRMSTCPRPETGFSSIQRRTSRCSE